MSRFWSRMTCVLAVTMLLLLAACGGSNATGNPSSTPASSGSSVGVLDPAKHYTVNFWEAFGTGANKTALETLTQQYMQKHPNVKVNLTPYADYTTLQTKLTAAIAAGTPPAISQVYEEWATQFQQAGSIASLQPFISGKNGLSSSDLSDFYGSLLKDGQINGTQYMLPFNKSDIVLYYNADVLNQLGITPPTTIADLETDLTKVTTADRWGLSFSPSVDEWSILYKAFGGGKFISDDAKTAEFASDANSQYAQKALGELAPLVKSGAVHVTKGFTWQNDFASQKSVFALSTIASYPFLVSAATSAKQSFQIQEAPVPAGPAGQFTVLFGTNLSIFSKADADTQNAAWDYVKYLTSTEVNATFVQKTGYMPVRQSAFSSAALQDYYTKTPARKVGPQSLPFAFVQSTVPAWDSCRNDISTNFISVLKGQMDAATGLAKMRDACQKHLSE